mgnify:CR=1 FL=1
MTTEDKIKIKYGVMAAILILVLFAGVVGWGIEVKKSIKEKQYTDSLKTELLLKQLK